MGAGMDKGQGDSKKEKKEMEAEHRQIHDLRLQVNSIRILMEKEDKQELHEILKKAEGELRKLEHEEGRIWRIQSREKWLREEEAPTRALPYFTLMTVGLSKQGTKLLQSVTRNFLWGENQQGRRKKPLLAWDCFERRKEEGGLGWPPLADMAETFLLRNVIKLLTGSTEEWVQIAEALICRKIQNSSKPQEVKNWTKEQVMMGLDNFKIDESPTLNRMLKAWFKVTRKLKWVKGPGAHPLEASRKLAL
ncbi:hypothetical protein R1sor_014783 [Riccia sorocarpa]|uniref:Uncharacterized protein n=1 Tax=Riccia sorocarpa TaxID=122646 RepID=A0ABD3HGI6_9MARC